MRRVVVTGLGAVTPIGGDAPSTWRAAVAGDSGIDFIRSFDASGFPVRIAAEVKDFDPTQVASPKDARRLDRNVLLALAAGRGAAGARGRPRRADLHPERARRHREWPARDLARLPRPELRSGLRVRDG